MLATTKYVEKVSKFRSMIEHRALNRYGSLVLYVFSSFVTSYFAKKYIFWVRKLFFLSYLFNCMLSMKIKQQKNIHKLSGFMVFRFPLEGPRFNLPVNNPHTHGGNTTSVGNFDFCVAHVGFKR